MSVTCCMELWRQRQHCKHVIGAFESFFTADECNLICTLHAGGQCFLWAEAVVGIGCVAGGANQKYLLFFPFVLWHELI